MRIHLSEFVIIDILPALQNNYIYVLKDTKLQKAAVIDPGDSKVVLDYLDRECINLNYIFNTHHHFDHTGGNLKIKNNTNAKIVGYKKDKHRIPGIDIEVEKKFIFGDFDLDILYVPGHTLGHIAFYLKKYKTLFSGDTLFAFGCGRVFEGTYLQMFNSLALLAKLPDETKVFCGHEYTLNNLKFALSVNITNALLQKKIKNVEDKLSSCGISVPTTIGEEKLLNPFLCKNFEDFIKFRQLKDNF